MEQERLDAEQKELDTRKSAVTSELKKIADEMANAHADLERIRPDGSVWKGCGKGLHPQHTPKNTTWNMAKDDEEQDDDANARGGEEWVEEDNWDADYDADDNESPVCDVEFNNWLQARHPDIYDTVTVYFDWEPPAGMLDQHYSNFSKENAHAEALRVAIRAHERGESKERWKKWVNKHLGFFLGKQRSAVPQDIRTAIEDEIISMDVDEHEETERNAAKRPRQRSNSPERGAKDDEDAEDEERGLPWVVDVPYLAPEPDGKLYHILQMDDQFECTLEAEESREQFCSQTGKCVPCETEAGITNQKKRMLLHKYLHAIHMHKDQWLRFPELEEYYKMVETKTRVAVDNGS